ncbi:energy-coupling factor transporter transmembrane component T family protein [Cohnella hongkongensis]|uniref:Energy-coupling factor transporter transmembrane component T family protein n=1 Tax=Cohnella hongkongensis TaxID=178337 RepID=A0ABV9FBA5_9BACL
MASGGYLIYEKRDSWLERWDPRIKITAFFLFGLSLIAHQSPALKTGQLLTLIVLWGVARLRWSTLAWTVLSLSLFFLSTMIFRAAIDAKPEHTLFRWAGMTLSREGIVSGLLMCEQILGIVVVLSLLVRTTSPIVLAEGLEKLCSPLKRWKVPVHDAVTMFSIALRFVPLLLEEFDTVRKAQTARGGGFHRGGFLTRFKGVLPMLIPLFVLSIQRAKELAVAMESRGYRGEEGRTPIREYRVRPSDTAVLAVSAMLMVAALLV